MQGLYRSAIGFCHCRKSPCFVIAKLQSYCTSNHYFQCHITNLNKFNRIKLQLFSAPKKAVQIERNGFRELQINPLILTFCWCLYDTQAHTVTQSSRKVTQSKYILKVIVHHRSSTWVLWHYSNWKIADSTKKKKDRECLQYISGCFWLNLKPYLRCWLNVPSLISSTTCICPSPLLI